MRYLTATVLSLFVALPALAQAPAKTANPKTCDCPICYCPVCECGVKPSTKSAEGSARLTYLLSSETSDADAAAALALALSEVKSIPPTSSNYTSQRLLAVAAHQHLVVGVNTEPPAGPWVSARSMDEDGTFASGKYLVVSYYCPKNQDVMTGPGFTRLPANASEAEIAAAIAKLQNPPTTVTSGQVYYIQGGAGACANGSCSSGNFGFTQFGMMGGCSGGSCGIGIRR